MERKDIAIGDISTVSIVFFFQTSLLFLLFHKRFTACSPGHSILIFTHFLPCSLHSNRSGVDSIISLLIFVVEFPPSVSSRASPGRSPCRLAQLNITLDTMLIFNHMILKKLLKFLELLFYY